MANKFYVHNDIFRYEDEVFGDSEAELDEGTMLTNDRKILFGFFFYLQLSSSYVHSFSSPLMQLTSLFVCLFVFFIPQNRRKKLKRSQRRGSPPLSHSRKAPTAPPTTSLTLSRMSKLSPSHGHVLKCFLFWFVNLV